MRKLLFASCLFALLPALVFGNYVSKVWVPDTGKGTYKNPVIDADYSDPDVCRVGDDYYMTASSFNCVPGLPVLHSKDLVNWTIVNYALKMQPPYDVYDRPQHGCGVWAPAIRYHDNMLYIYWGDPDYGIYMVRTADLLGDWEEPVLVKPGKGLIDPCPLWDEDGKAYLVHGVAGSRATFKSLIVLSKMSPDGTEVLDGQGRVIFDGHDDNETVEGTKFYKHNGYYWIFAPAGGVKTGWQLAMRSKDVNGPYEYKIVLAQGNTDINGPHQGAWVDTPDGKEDWFIHFQDKGVYGRVTHLQPMAWKNGWPVIGVDPDGDGTGEPVLTYKKPNVGKAYPKATPVESDDFTSRELGLQWQWHANPNILWYYAASEKGLLRLFSVVQPEPLYGNMLDSPNLLLQKFPTEQFSAVTKLTFTPSPRMKGERAGLIVMGFDYAMLTLENTADGITISQVECYKADQKRPEKVNASESLKTGTVWLKVDVRKGGKCTFSYSTDGKRYKTLGKELQSKEGRWIGSKVGIFCNRPVLSNDGGWIDVDYFNIEPLK